jgi:Tol biopolymer transport system component
MTLRTGARLGPYEIVSLIGTGGMGEVYKARDVRLDRTVAVKLLSPDVASRPDLRRRFQTEARAISSLSHPNICPLFDVGEQDGRAFLVMEYLQGETLDDRLTRGLLAPREVLRYAAQIADALDHAHTEGIVHRDLKPSNIFLCSRSAAPPLPYRPAPATEVSGGAGDDDSEIKLLDFGLAKGPLLEPVSVLSTASFDQRQVTAEGTVVGTLQYMAPEQLEGKSIDSRTDIFAFGMVLYEMATGRKAFAGESQASLIASILTTDPPPISSLGSGRGGAGLPAALDHIVERCLAKRPADRWQTARDVKVELEWAVKGDSRPIRAAKARQSARREMVAWAVAFLSFVVAAVAIGWPAFRRAPEPVTAFEVLPPAGTTIGLAEIRTRVAVSPDGRQVAFVASTDSVSRIWVRSLDNTQARPLAGTEGGVSPFWSPNSQYIGFFLSVQGQLRKIEASGGPARTICQAQVDSAPAWGPDNTILFTEVSGGIYRVSADGGTPARLTTPDNSRREMNHYWPEFLPDGRHFLYMSDMFDAEGRRGTPIVYVAAFDGSPARPLTSTHSRTVYADPGYLLFVHDGALLAQPFDSSALQLTGDAVKLVDGVAFFRTVGTGGFSVSKSDTLVYQGSIDEFKLVWYDRSANPSASIWPSQNFASVSLSPDDQELAVEVVDAKIGTSDIWMYEMTGATRKLTTELTSEGMPVWAPGGRTVMFRTERSGPPGLFAKALDTGVEELLIQDRSPLYPSDWSSDGKWIAYGQNPRTTGFKLWIKPTSVEGKPVPFSTQAYQEWGAQFSPDSTMVAFVSNESETPEVFVAPVQNPGGKEPISIKGGNTPRWRRDGKELFYASTDRRSIWAVPIQTRPFRKGVPRQLIWLGATAAVNRARDMVYDVDSKGERFLVSFPEDSLGTSRITVLKNWQTLLRR